MRVVMIFVAVLSLSGHSLQAQENASEVTVEKPAMHVSDAALKVHFSGMLFDGHNDLPWVMREKAASSFDQVDIAKPTKFHTDIQRLKKGGVKAQFWSVYVPAETTSTGSAMITTIEQIDLVHEMCRRYPDVFQLALTADDVEKSVAAGKIASLIGMEGGHSIENSLQNLQRLYDRGARYMTLTHSKTLDWADSATDEARHNGLTDFGKEVVREMNRMGMLVDISHVSDKTMHDVLDISSVPVIFSHSSVRAINEHKRNVPDDVLKRLAKNGGVVMITFVPSFTVPTEEIAAEKNARGTYKTIVDHLEHAVKLAGIDHVGIGSDFDGVDNLPVGLDDVSYYPNITQELLKRGYTAEQIHKILGANILRVLRAAGKPTVPKGK